MPNPMYFMPEVGTIKINLLSPLDILQIVDTSARKYEFVNFPNVDRVSLFIIRHPDSHSNLYTLLKGLCNVKSLTLSPNTVEYLIHSMEDNLDNLSLLTFHNLSSLSLSVKMSENYRWNMLVNFLQSAPNLKDLAIK
ncbi:F-box/LRR-repeat protein, partial [Trifolium medium]|nr:F-box/LRR-repeat protein [Trifolium medium]